MAESTPRVIVNASSGGADWAVTAEGPVRLAMTAAKHGSRLVHVSSDAVFSSNAEARDAWVALLLIAQNWRDSPDLPADLKTLVDQALPL